MMEKLERLLDLMIAYYERALDVPLEELTTSPPAPSTPRRTRKPKAEPAAAAPAAIAEDPTELFGMGPTPTPTAATAAPAAKPKAAPAAPTAEEFVEAKRRCQDTIVLFVKRYLKSTPSGRDRALAVIQDECPAVLGKKVEDFSYDQSVQLAARFEKELAKAA